MVEKRCATHTSETTKNPVMEVVGAGGGRGGSPTWIHCMVSEN